MESLASESHVKSPEADVSFTLDSTADNTDHNSSSKVSTSGLSGWAKSLKIPQSLSGSQNESPNEDSAKSKFSRFTSSFVNRLSPKASPKENSEGTATSPQSPRLIDTITKGIVDSSKNAVKAVQVKARHVVSQNKRRYQDDGFDLDMTYITENIIAMGFPAGDKSSGFLGYVEGFYRNHMEEVIKFFETHHKDKYKVYNLCSERLYDASLFEGKVATFPFNDHNCPPVQLIMSFCHSAYSWLKEDIENVVVVHCKAGMARTGLMISSLLLYLKFFPTAEESIDYYNQKRCFDGKALVLPSQIRYVKYFERTLTYFNGENQPGRRCMLRGIRLHRCPYWIRPSITVSDHNGVLFSTKKHHRTKDLSPEDFWFSAPKKGIMVFAIPREPGLTEVTGDFKIHFHDRQGDFYWYAYQTHQFQITTFVMIRFERCQRYPSEFISTSKYFTRFNFTEVESFDLQKVEHPSCLKFNYTDVEPHSFWLNTTMMENRKILNTNDLDGFDKRKLPSPGFQVEVVLADYDPTAMPTPESDSATASATITTTAKSTEDSGTDTAARPNPSPSDERTSIINPNTDSSSKEKDSVFSADESGPSKNTQVNLATVGSDRNSSIVNETHRMSLNESAKDESAAAAGGEISEFKAMAADASVFSFGDEEDFESD